MIHPFSISAAASAAGIPARYVYWVGRSGRRFLFTATERRGIDDFDGGVAIAVRAGAIVWAGEVAALAWVPRTAWLVGAEFYVHLLAATAEARRGVIDDLRPAVREPLRLAA